MLTSGISILMVPPKSQSRYRRRKIVQAAVRPQPLSQSLSSLEVVWSSLMVVVVGVARDGGLDAIIAVFVFAPLFKSQIKASVPNSCQLFLIEAKRFAALG